MINASSSRSIAALVVLTGLAVLSNLPAAAEGQHAVMRSNPVQLEINVGQTATLTVVLADAQDVYGIDVSATFDPQLVEVVDADPAKDGVQAAPGAFPKPDFVARNVADNQAGTLRYAVTQVNPTEPVDGSGVVFTIQFRAKASSGQGTFAMTSVDLSDRDGIALGVQPESGVIRIVPAEQAAPPATTPATPIVPTATPTDTPPPQPMATVAQAVPASTPTSPPAPAAPQAAVLPSPTAAVAEPIVLPTDTPVSAAQPPTAIPVDAATPGVATPSVAAPEPPAPQAVAADTAMAAAPASAATAAQPPTAIPVDTATSSVATPSVAMPEQPTPQAVAAAAPAESSAVAQSDANSRQAEPAQTVPNVLPRRQPGVEDASAERPASGDSIRVLLVIGLAALAMAVMVFVMAVLMLLMLRR